MSIQSIEKNVQEGSTTRIEKEMLSGSLGMLMDLVQRTQYAEPEASTVRELVSNAVDSQNEKIMALNILQGKAKPEDFFVEKEDMDSDKYKYSKWNPEYYDINHLSKDVNTYITYTENTEETFGFCDTLSIKDYGVGLDAERLMLTTMIGQSTKRLNKTSLGAFGFGAKVALSTDCGYYDVISVYNGKKFSVRCFERYIEDITPKRDEKFKPLPEEKIDGISLRYQPTTELNSVEIKIPSRRISKSRFITAIQEQLLYFNNIIFTVISGANKKEIPIRATILYESDDIVISNQSVYNKPHILICSDPKNRGDNMVCYGYIDFEEIELPEKYGSVGIKCPIYAEVIDPLTGNITKIPGVTVTPSREKIRQGDKISRDFISDVFLNRVVKEAENYVNANLKGTTDFFKWLEKVVAITHRYHSSNSETIAETKILAAFQSIIELETISPIHSSTGIVFRAFKRTFPGIKITKIRIKERKRIFSKELNKWIESKVLERIEVDSWSEFNPESFKCLKRPGEHHSKAKDVYLLSSKNINYFYTLELPENAEENPELTKADLKNLENLKPVLALLKDYAEIEIPKNYSEEYDILEREEKKEEAARSLTPQERRDKFGLKLVTTFQPVQNYQYGRTEKLMVWGNDTKMELSPEELKNLEGDVYYMFEEDIELYADWLFIFCKKRVTETLKENANPNLFFSEDKKFVKISKATLKDFGDNVKHISQFFNRLEENHFTMDSELIKWNTARIIKKDLESLKFLTNFAPISKEIHEKYARVTKYVADNFWDNNFQMYKRNATPLRENLEESLDKLFELQEFVLLHKNDEEILEEGLLTKFENAFGITSATVADYQMIQDYRELLDFAEGIKDLLNQSEKLTNEHRELSFREIRAIKEYIYLIKQKQL